MSTPEAVSQKHIQGIDVEGQALMKNFCIVFIGVY